MAASMRTALRASSTSTSVSVAVASVACISSFSPAKAQVQPVTQPTPTTFPPPPPSPDSAHHDATIRRRRALSKTYFDATGALWVGDGGDKPPDPNKTKLGKTLRILQERLPTLLQSPLPHDLLAPNISLHLFPSTHPHLPTVSGRVAYNAALWTSPIAWNRVPIIGNVKIEILAERMTSEPLTFLPRRPGAIPEQLVVRWCEKRKTAVESGVAKAMSFGKGVDPNKAFTGLFIFDFDHEGRILSHTIEQAQAGNNWEAGVGAKFVGLTDWLLGGMQGGDTPLPTFGNLRKRCHD